MTDTLDPDNPRLVALAAAVADGVEVDREAASGADADAGSDSALAQEMLVLGRIRRVFRPPIELPPPFRPVADADIPGMWGPLQIIRKVGHGSFGRVFEAVDSRLARTVALKLFDTVPEETAANVVPEARLLAQVRHENVVTVFGADHFHPAVGVWMEFVNGRTLSERCDESDPFSAAEALLIGLDVCRALAAVHRAGFVHGDVKAQNVMRQAGGRIVLTDFGAARLIRFTDERRRRNTVTPYYAAPELLAGAAPNVSSDLYAVGVLLYFLVTGKFPVTGETPREIQLAHLNNRRTLLRDVRPDLPQSFIHVVDVATAPLPEDRPGSAGALEALIARATGRVSMSALARRDAPAEAAGQSIAVLPFADMSADRSLGHFCEGVAEEIIDALKGIPGLRVVPRTSAFTVEQRARTAKRVGAVLNVRTVLQGRVQASGSRLRVAARLTDTVTGVRLWSRQFSRGLADLFGVQEEIARAACHELGLRLRPALENPADGATGRDSEAYTLYLKGRYCWNQRTELALQKSVTYFQSAIDKDPGYAPAYAALAEATTTLGLYGVVAPHDIMRRARAAASRAIELAGDSPAAHATAACIAALYDWDWPGAARGYHRAMEVNPEEPSAHHWYAINYLVPLRRFEEAATELERAAEVDPLSMPIRASFGIRSYFAHDFARAHGELRECLDVDRGSATARLFLGLTLVEMGRLEDAIGELETATRVAGSPEMTAALGYACARGGRLDRARGLLGELLLLSEQRYVSASLVAQVHAGFGSPDQALEWLERAHEARAADLAWLAVRPVFDTLHADPRFNALVSEILG